MTDGGGGAFVDVLYLFILLYDFDIGDWGLSWIMDTCAQLEV